MLQDNSLVLLIFLLPINNVNPHNYVRLTDFKQYYHSDYGYQSQQQQQQQQYVRYPKQQQHKPHKQFARSLIYPPTAPTRLQFIGGIGIPVEDLHFESITSGYVLKAEYFLPEHAEDFTHVYLKPQIINGRNLYESSDNQTDDTSESTYNNSSRILRVDNFKSQHKNASIYRWILYHAIEMILETAGQAGHSCMLRSICEHATLPINHASDGLLAEIVHIILTPSTSIDAHDKQTIDYLIAERLGRRGIDCAAKYTKCIKSPIDIISMIL